MYWKLRRREKGCSEERKWEWKEERNLENQREEMKKERNGGDSGMGVEEEEEERSDGR